MCPESRERELLTKWTWNEREGGITEGLEGLARWKSGEEDSRGGRPEGLGTEHKAQNMFWAQNMRGLVWPSSF